MVKRTPTKSVKNIKNFRNSRRSRRKSPLKNASGAASAVLASINKSIYTCHRRLIKIFTKLACIATPKKTPRKKGYHILQKVPANPPETESVRRTLFTERKDLPPPLDPEKKTIFLDLDETLVHSATNPLEKYDFRVGLDMEGEKVEFYVVKRPFVDEFLSFLSQRFEVVVFTAGIERYASLVLDRLDRKSLISHRLYRDSCREVDGKLVKDLSQTGRDLNKVAIVDDNPNSYILQPDNAIPIKPFIDDMGDSELKKLIEFFQNRHAAEDMRDAAKVYRADKSQERPVRT